MSVLSDDGEMLHELEMLDLVVDGKDVVIRDPNGHHISDTGECDCSWTCCLAGPFEGGGEYVCICPDCNGCLNCDGKN